MTWEIVYYDTPSGQTVIKDFIDGLQENTQAKLGRQLDLLEEHGNRLGMPHAKAMGDGLIPVFPAALPRGFPHRESMKTVGFHIQS